MKQSVFYNTRMDLKLKSFYIDLIVTKNRGNELIKFYVKREFIVEIEFNQINDYVEAYHINNEQMIEELNTHTATVKEFIRLLPIAFIGNTHEFNVKLNAIKQALNLNNYSYECLFKEALSVNRIEGN